MSHNIYDFKINSLEGAQIDFADYKGKTLLLVNTASKCGFTPQYAGLQLLYQKYKANGLVVIGFPCNQFGGQEPELGLEIKQNCLVRYGVTFPITEKVEVNGENEHPVFSYLKNSLPGILGTEDIKWNFTKFLIDPTGVPQKRYAPTVEPENIESDIQTSLGLK